jgi:5,6-dimethylbenzimidazole synthase
MKLPYTSATPARMASSPLSSQGFVVPDSFTQQEKDAVYRAIAQRRDIRHFIPDPVDEAVLARILAAAHHAPSVGFMQPWRFVRVVNRDVREALIDLVETERVQTADALGERGAEFMRLKVEGIRDCGEVLVVALMDGRESFVFGRRTMPEMDLASVSCAIQNMWLASRAEGLGMGWVSLFDPEQLATLLKMPAGAKPVAILCLGHVKAFYPKPMLELEGWEQRAGLDGMVFIDRWTDAAPADDMHQPAP